MPAYAQLQSLKSSPKRGAFLTFIIGLTLTIVLALFSQKIQREKTVAQFTKDTSVITEQVRDLLNNQVYGLRGARGAIIGSSPQDYAKRFDTAVLSRKPETEFVGSLGLGFSRHVKRANVPQFIEQVRARGNPNYTLKRLSDAPNEDYWIVESIRPNTGPNQAVFGLDMGSEQKRYQAIKLAIERAEAVVSEPITLVRSVNKKDLGFLIILPVYDTPQAPNTVAERWQRQIGIVYSVVEADILLADLDFDHNHVDFALSAWDGERYQLIHDDSPNGQAASPIELSQTLELYNKKWLLTYKAKPAFITQSGYGSLKLSLALGVIVSLLASVLTYALVNLRVSQLDNLANTAYLSRIIENAFDAIITLNAQGRVTSWNRAAEKLFGYSEERALGQDINELIVPEAERAKQTLLNQRVAAGEAYPRFVTQRQNLQGSLIHVSLTAFPIEAAVQGDSLRTVALIISDATKQVLIEEQMLLANSWLEAQVEDRTIELQRSRRNLQAILDAIPSTIAYWDKNLINQFANKAHESWYGKAPEMLKGSSLADMMGIDAVEDRKAHLDGILQGIPQFFERDIPRIDSTFSRHALIQYLPDIADNDEVLGFYSISQDITELIENRRQLESVIRQNEVLLRTINQQLLYSVTDAKGTIIEVNDNFCEVSGYEQDELIGQNHRIINSGQHPRTLWTDMWRTLTQGHAWRHEICNRNKSGELYWVDTVIAPFMNENGEVERYVSLRTDITQRKLAEKELNRVAALLGSVLNAASEGGHHRDRSRGANHAIQRRR